MKEEDFNLDKLEEVKFKAAKDAGKPKTVTCSKCNIKMQKAELTIDLDSGIGIKLVGFECSKCKKRYLGLDESKKLDKAMIMARLMNHDNYKIRKSLSFDGDNYIFRIPIDIARSLGKKPSADMVPLSSTDFFIHLNKKNK